MRLVNVVLFSCHRPTTDEYKQHAQVLLKIAAEHHAHLVPGAPQLDWCDNAVRVRSVLCYINILLKYRIFLFMLFDCIHDYDVVNSAKIANFI